MARGTFGEYGVRINSVGRTELLPPEIRDAVAKAEELTKNNDR
jgi:ditrans,polycis-polyprenyl diphosphate synthase